MRDYRSSIRAVGWIIALSIVVLSLVPGRLRPHVLPNNYLEHFVAYLSIGCVFAAGYPARSHRIILGIMLAVGAGALEVAQLFIAGRTSSVEDFAAGVVGAWLGLGLPFVMQRLFGRQSNPA
jgi:VanZ family protein